jgi:hypothetical protein
LLKSYRSTTLVTSQSGGKFSKVPKKKKHSIPSSIFFFYCGSMWVYLSKNIVLLTQERGSKCMQPVYHLQYFFIVVPCGCTYPKILFYLPKKEVRSGCTQSLIRFYFKNWTMFWTPKIEFKSNNSWMKGIFYFIWWK